MSEILDRAKAAQAKCAENTYVTMRLDLLEGLIAEIETLWAVALTPREPPVGSIRDIRARHQLKDDPS
jgi:hypothetical protein